MHDDIRADYHQGEETVIELIDQLIAIILSLTERVKQLEDPVAKKSSKSSKPPYSDGF
jgi:hypothetical protein